MLIIADDKIPFLDGRLPAGIALRRLPAAGIDADAVRHADALLVRTRTRCDSSLLAGSRVSFIATATIGTDHIDTRWCRQSGIAVANAPGCNAPGVAQYVWSALLRLGFDPARHTLGIVGQGHVGTIVAEWGRALGARLLVSDPPRQSAALPALSSDGSYTPLDRLLRHADAVTLHTPLTLPGESASPTHHLIDADAIAMMRPGAILVNAARGAVADNRALADAAGAHRIRVVADTWENEPHILPLLLHTAAYATPHIAGYSAEGKQRATAMALQALGRHFGFSPGLDGLAPPYAHTDPPSAARILASYDPAADTAALRSDPAAFERLRSEYRFRHEP